MPYSLKTIWWTNVIIGILDPCDAKIYHIKCMWVSDLHFMVQWFDLISWKTFWWRNVVLKILIQCSIKYDLQIYMWVSNLYFVVQWFCFIYSVLFDEQASFFGYWFSAIWALTCISWFNNFESFTYFCLKWFVEVWYENICEWIGQLFAEGVRWGHPCTLDTFLVFLNFLILISSYHWPEIIHIRHTYLN